MRRVVLALLLSLGMVSPATAKDGAARQARDPHKALQYYQRGLAESRRDQNAAAIADFEQSIALDPDRFETYKALDDVLHKERQWATVVQYWTQYIGLHPNDGRAYCDRGGAYSWLHDSAHMRADAEKACSLGDQQCCQIVRAHAAPPQVAPSSAPLPLIFWALMAMILSFPALLVVYLIRGPKAFSSLDLFLKSAALSGVCLGILYYTHIVSGNSLVPLFCGITPASVGVFLFARGFALYREFRVILNTSESPIQGLAMGFVEVHGKATAAQTVLSPVSQTPCLFYKVVLEGKGRVPHRAGGRTERGDFIKVDLGGNPFYLEDATGKVRVDPTGVECDLLLNKETRFKLSGWRKINASADELIRYANNLAISWNYISECHFLEYCVLPGHWYDLAGTCVENPEPQDALDRNMIVKGSEEPTFLISWRSEQGIRARLRRRAAYDIYLGGALILLGAAIGLAIIGLL